MYFLVAVSLNFCFILGSFADSSCGNIPASATNKNLAGGWQYINGPDLQEGSDLHEQVNLVVQAMASKYNMESNDIAELDIKNAKIDKVYYQVVAGMNYCIKFTVRSSGCKNNIKDTQNKMLCNEEYKCEGKAYQPLPIAVQGVVPGPEIEKVPVCVKTKFLMKDIM